MKNLNIANVEGKARKSVKSPPTVVLAKPSQKKMTTIKERETIKAYVRDVRKKRHIVVRINGKRTRRFKFRKRRGLIKIKARLDQGENIIEIIATNKLGEDSQSLSITREREAGEPSVEIIRPSGTISTSQKTVLVMAQLENVEHRDDIVVLIDGLEREFTYHASSGILRAEIDLEIGTSHLVINAYNRNGKKASAKKWISRNKPNYNPTISINAPIQQPFYTEEEAYLIKAIVRNIEDMNQIDFIFNGEQSFDFTYNSSTKEFMAYVNLREGSNIFRIQTTNTHGTEQASGTIIYQYENITPIAVERPIIEMITPTAKVYTSENQLYINAKIYNVFDVSDIVFTANGMNCVDFGFDVNTGILTSTQSLKDGYNSFIITVKNQTGEATHTVEATLENTSVNYAPIVSLIYPNMQLTTTQASVSVKASLKHVANRSQITVRYNGQMVSNFLLSGGTHKYLEFEAKNLRNGKNYIDISVSNAYGQDKLTAVVTYNKPITRPVVSILSPITNGQSIDVQQKLVTLKAKVLYANTQQIKVLLNGKEQVFQMLGNTLMSKFDLKNGKNTIAVVANNGKTTQATIVLDYKVIKKPNVILSNLKGNVVTKKKSFTVQGQIKNVTSRNSIQVLVNDQVFTQYNFNPYTGSLTFTAPLKRGKNSIQVSATNNDGQASNRSTVIYDDGTEAFDGK